MSATFRSFVLSILLGLGGSTLLFAEEPSCPICFEEYTHDSIIMQLDCNQSVSHHFCSFCLQDVISRGQPCPQCRAPMCLHDPRVTQTTIHHMYRPLERNEQEQLSTLLAVVPHSSKPMPQSIFKECTACKAEHPSIQVHFTCTHTFCVSEALQLSRSGITNCPQCSSTIILVDPLKKEHIPALMYQQRRLTSKELEDLDQLRAVWPVYQDHIPSSKRMPLKTMRPQTYSLPSQYMSFDDLSVCDQPFPDRPLTFRDIQLTNSYLPKHISKTVWQVVELPNGTYARARRARQLPSWPYTSSSKTSKDFMLGALCGYLLVPELTQTNTLLWRIASTASLLYAGKRFL